MRSIPLFGLCLRDRRHDQLIHAGLRIVDILLDESWPNKRREQKILATEQSFCKLVKAEVGFRLHT